MYEVIKEVPYEVVKEVEVPFEVVREVEVLPTDCSKSRYYLQTTYRDYLQTTYK